MKEVKSVEEFDKILSSSKVPIVIDFWAPWCGPCKMIAPLLQKLSNEYKDKIEIYSVDVDELPELATRFEVFSIPTLIFTQDGGKSFWEKVGAVPYEELKKEVELFFSKDEASTKE